MEHTGLKLYIKLENGQPILHPILHNNFVAAFPNIDPENLPPDQFAKFIRVTKPNIGVYEILVSEKPVYEWVGDVVKDVWKIRPMTDVEKETKQQIAKGVWAARPQAENWAAWTFDEATCGYVPPIPRPDPVEGKIVFWCGADNNWKEAPPRPNDGKPYKFDFLAWQWVEVTSGK